MTLAKPGELTERLHTLAEMQRATINILEDFNTERQQSEQVQRASLNVLEDFEEEKERVLGVQRATLNILEDFHGEKVFLESTQRAFLNILEDVGVERNRVAFVNEQLEVSNKELEAFTYSVSHDLRAPLRRIDGFAQLLVEDYGAQLPSEAQDYLRRVRTGTRQMGQLVDQLLSLARIGRQSVNLQIAGLDSLVKEVISDLKGDTDGRNIQWNVQSLPFVECDPGLTKVVLTNLLSNAVKYTRPRQPAVIDIGSGKKDGVPYLFVRDNGVGFSMKYADKLFGVFQRLHRAEDFEGTGIGLATVQRIVHKHGGRIWAEAEVDRGACFYFTLQTQLSVETQFSEACGNGTYVATGH